MKYIIETIKATPLGFRLWFHLYRKPKLSKKSRKFFGKETKFFITGFPRSGNTYAAFLIDNIFKELNYVHHFHSVGPIKIALKSSVPVCVLVRDPLNAITSYYLKLLSFENKDFQGNVDIKLLQSAAEFYLFYHEGVNKLRNKIEIISFYELTKNPLSVLSRVNKIVDYGLSDTKLKEMFDIISKREFGTRDTLGSSLPNETKDNHKEVLKQSLLNLPVYKSCEALYDQILNKIS